MSEPTCGHQLFTDGCSTCFEWVSNGKWMGTAMKKPAQRRDPVAQEQIAVARGPVVTPVVDSWWTCSSCHEPQDALGPVGDSYGRCQQCSQAGLSVQSPVEPLTSEQTERAWERENGITLAGADQETFAAFAAICAKLEENQRAGADLMKEYQAALSKVSAMAARHAR